MNSSQYVVTGIVVVAVLVGAYVSRSRTWHRSPQRFWTLPVIASVGLIVAAPAGEVASPAGVGLLVVGAAVGLAAGTFRGGARFTTVGVDPDGKIAYRPSMLGIVALLAVFGLHYLANLLADSVTALQFVLTVLLSLGVGETFGWHVAVFRRWRRMRDEGGPEPAAD